TETAEPDDGRRYYQTNPKNVMKLKTRDDFGLQPHETARERVLCGLAVGPGVAIGVAYIHDTDAVNVPEYHIPPGAVARERARFAEAAEEVRAEVARLQEKAKELAGTAGEDLSYLLDAYQQMLTGSRLMRGVDSRIGTERLNAEAAVYKEISVLVEAFAAMNDTYLAARADDIRDIGKRLIRSLTRIPYRPFSMLPRNAVILAEDLTPADTALLDPEVIAGFATVLGGTASHTAIMARSLGFPAVLGIPHLLKDVASGTPVIVDGTSGQVIIDPTGGTLLEYRRRRARFLREKRALNRLKGVPAITRDHQRISMHANIELPGEVDVVQQAGAEGIGLLRSEFMFMNRMDLPDEEEQFTILRQLVEQMAGRVVTVRTLDCGGEKISPVLNVCVGPNPALGLRAIRLGLSRPELLSEQLAAILRAGVYGPVRILLPMVATVEELRAVRALLHRVVRRLVRRGVPLPDSLPPVGVMIEVPAAALAADTLAWHADFFAIGTNDLTQYTLAIDRTDEAVAHLYNPLHPAVLRLIQFATEAARRADIPLSVCGEMAGDPRYTALLLGLGIHELSMSAYNIPRVKRRIRTLALHEATRHVHWIMKQSDSALISRMVDDFNARE
ncbi:MAG: phosphotransferase system enzyme I PtsI, partial [Rhodospirillaceae bacterium]